RLAETLFLPGARAAGPHLTPNPQLHPQLHPRQHLESSALNRPHCKTPSILHSSKPSNTEVTMRRSTHGQSAPEDHDSPWIGALEVFFQPFMDFLYPQIAELIDWQQPVEFLEKELQILTRKAKISRRYADKLVKVRFLNGSEQWI